MEFEHLFDPAMQHMLQSHGFQLSEETIRKTVTNMGFMWAPGHRRRVAAERPENILFRTHYLRMKRNNRDENNLPILPEVFIDESYVHLYHSAQKTWVHDVNDKLFGVPEGKGARFVIVGAGVLYQQDGVLHGKWVENSVRVWNSTHRKRKKRGRRYRRDEDASSTSSSDFEENYYGNCHELGEV